jgi:hypothetical protein
MMLGADPRFVAWAAGDLTNAAEALRDAELRRAVLYSKLASAEGWPAEPFDWERLAELAGEPHATILYEVKEALATLTTELNSQLTAIKQLGEAGLAGVTDFLESLASPEALVNTAAAHSSATRWQPPAGPARVDRKL